MLIPKMSHAKVSVLSLLVDGVVVDLYIQIVIVLSGLCKDKLSDDEFLVVHIEGLINNGDIDPRNREVGYMCCCGSNVPQTHFFDWFYENVTCSTISEIRRKYNPFCTEETTEVP